MLTVLGDAVALFGLYALIVARIRISSTFRLEGKRARIAGVIFMLPYALNRAFGNGLPTLLCLAGGVGYALLTRPKPPSKPRSTVPAP